MSTHKNKIDTLKNTKLNENNENDLYLLEQKIRALQNNRRTLLRQKYDFEKSLAEFSKELKKIKKTPLIIGQIEEIYNNEQKAVVRSSNGPSFIVNWSKDVSPEDLKVGANVALNQRNYAIIEVLEQNTDPYVAQMELEEKSDTTFDDLGGLDKQILELKEAIDLPLTNPDLFSNIGIDPPCGVLLLGPPGSGKTLLAKAIANYSNANFISVVGSALVQKYIGEGTRIVKELFRFAESKAPSIIFIDELDAIGSRREVTTSGDLEVQRTLMELLAQMDGFKEIKNVKIIGATNRPDILDPALIRSGRFDKHLEIPIPNREGRKQIFNIYLNDMAFNYVDTDLDRLANLSDNFNGAMIKAVCTEAGIQAIRRNEEKILMSDFIQAINNSQFNLKNVGNSQSLDTYT